MPPIPPPEPALLREAAARALGEDRGPADITSHAFIPADARARARLFVKEPAILAGLPVAEEVFRIENASLALAADKADGDRLAPGDTVLRVEGPLRAILGAERAALNFLQHLSGIATLTGRFVAAVAGTKAAILDTRKTTPGLRHLEKYAVRCGGGVNHRFGLYDHFLVKDNHLARLAPAALPGAIAEARRLAPEALLEFEADTLEQAALFASLGVDRILLDNMTVEQMAEAARRAAGRCRLEASGNMTLERVAAVAAAGVDFISVGALTHSAPAIDFSLEVLP